MQLVSLVILSDFRGKPIALEHLRWYLSTGRGRDFVEDANIRLMLERDTGVQALLTSFIGARTSGTFSFQFKLEQTVYANQDLRSAFGAVDCVDVEVDFGAGTIHVWFQDRYEWHPFYPGLYTAFPDDGPIETNCVHAALVELKATGAADFWMIGEATVPLVTIRSAAAAAAGSGVD